MMFELADKLNELIPGFMLTLSRISAMVMTLPVIGYPLVAPRIRITFALILTIIIFPVISSPSVVIDSLPVLFINITREVMIGFIIGFGTRVLFEGFNLAGGIVGRQMGIGMANVMDPTTNRQFPIVSQFWMYIMITFFLVANGHYLFIETIFKNFQLIPLGGVEFVPALGQAIIRTNSSAYDIGIQFAAPAIVFLLLVDTAIAITGRVMPQMNIFLVTLPLKIGAGIFILMASLNIFQVLFNSVYKDISLYLMTVITLMSGT